MKPLRWIKFNLLRYKNRFKWHIKSCPKVDLASLKSEIDRLGIGKLEPNPGDLSKLINVGKNEIVKKLNNCYSGWPCRQFNQNKQWDKS